MIHNDNCLVKPLNKKPSLKIDDQAMPRLCDEWRVRERENNAKMVTDRSLKFDNFRYLYERFEQIGCEIHKRRYIPAILFTLRKASRIHTIKLSSLSTTSGQSACISLIIPWRYSSLPITNDVISRHKEPPGGTSGCLMCAVRYRSRSGSRGVVDRDLGALISMASIFVFDMY